MKKREAIKFSILVIFFISICLAVLFGYEQNYKIKYYENFEYISSVSNQQNEIIFTNELSSSETKDKWHVKVYLDHNGELIKFENYNKKGTLYDTTPNTLKIKVTQN